MVAPRQFKNEINDILRSFRLGLDRKSTDLTLEDRVVLSKALDGMRVINRYVGTSRFLFEEELQYLLAEARKFRSLVELSGIGELAAYPLATSRTRIADLLHEVTNLELADILIQTIEDVPSDSVIDVSLPFGEPSRLADVIPEQKISPVHFDVVNDVLTIAHLPAVAAPDDAENTRSARSALIEQGRKILGDLEISNCDRRFLSDVQALQAKLETSEDIIQLGIMNLACEEQGRQFAEELPSVLASKLRSHFTTVGMYVAQFQAWVKFTENAAAVELNEADVRKSHEAALEIAAKFEKMADTVSPEVPATIRLISNAIDDPARAGKKVGFALIRTLENLFIRVFGYAAKFTDESVNKSIAYGSSAVAISFCTVVYSYANGLASIYERVPGMAWLKTAVEIFGKYVTSIPH